MEPESKRKIIEMIENLPFTKIPHENFFNISTSSNVRETMRKALEIVKMKAGLTIKDAVEKASPFSVFAVELKPFVRYLGGLMRGYETDLPSYIKILEWNNYLKIRTNKDLLDQLNDEISFLCQFTQVPNEDQNSEIKQDWTKIADLRRILTATHDNASSIMSWPGNDFSNWQTRGNVATKPTSDNTYAILTYFKLLYEIYKEQEEVENGKHNKNSKYYDERVLRELVGYEDETYEEMVPYNDIEEYEEEVEYNVMESYTERESRTRPVVKVRTVKYMENVPVTKMRTETYQFEEDAPIRTIIWTLLTFGILMAARQANLTDTVTKTREVPYTDWEPTEKTRDEEYTEYETYDERVTKDRPVTKTKIDKRRRTVVKEKMEIKTRKCPVFKEKVIKEFNLEKHEEHTQIIGNEILKYRKLIEDKIKRYPKVSKLGEHNRVAIISKDRFEEKYKDLQELWQDAEYRAYFAQNPDKSLAEIDIQCIANLVKDISCEKLENCFDITFDLI